jgi:hypothetical protein
VTYPSLTTVGTERTIDVNTLQVPAVLICYAQATQDGATAIELAVREKQPDVSSLLVAHVIDLRSVPRMFRGVAEGVLRGEYRKAVAELAEDEMPYDHVVILPDWDGGFIYATGLEDVSKRLGVAVFAPGGRLVGLEQSDKPVKGTLRLLTEALTS